MTSIRQGAAGVLAGMLAGVLSAYGAEVTISGSAGTSGTVSFNGGASSQTVQISVEEGTRVNVVAAADDEHAFSHWTGDVDAVCEGGALQSNIVVQARAGLSLTAVFGLRNRLDSGDLRPHGYLNRFTQKDDGSWSAAWTDGPRRRLASTRRRRTMNSSSTNFRAADTSARSGRAASRLSSRARAGFAWNRDASISGLPMRRPATCRGRMASTMPPRRTR